MRFSSNHDNRNDGPLFPVLQPSSAVLGEHPQEPSLHFRCPRVGSGGRLALCHRPDVHGRLHQEWAQTQPGEWKREPRRSEVKEQDGKIGEKTKKIRTKWMTWDINRLRAEVNQFWSAIVFDCCPLFVSRTLQVTNYSMQRRSPPIRRWWMSKSCQHFTIMFILV